MAKNEKAYKARKDKQLGEDIGIAKHKLKKNIYLWLIQKAGLDNCYQCGNKLTDVNDITIEHKEPFIGSFDPQIMFYDLRNIAFSHRKCNVDARRKKTKIIEHPSNYLYNEGCRCEKCVEWHSVYYKRRKVVRSL